VRAAATSPSDLRQADDFSRHRSLLFTIAYEMLGSAADAEDVLQESWLRWRDVNSADVREPRACLVRNPAKLQAIAQPRAISLR